MNFIECAMQQIIQLQSYRGIKNYGFEPYEFNERESRC